MVRLYSGEMTTPYSSSEAHPVYKLKGLDNKEGKSKWSFPQLEIILLSLVITVILFGSIWLILSKY